MTEQTPAGEACLVTWPTDPTAGDLMPAYVRPQHRCTLDAAHVHVVVETRLDELGRPAPYPLPHRCHCGSWQPVRDVEPAVEL